MCYSAMVYADLKKSGLRIQSRVDLSLFESAYERREKGEPIKFSSGLDGNFLHPNSPEEKRILGSIERFNRSEIAKLEGQLFEQRKKLADAERKLQLKETVTARKAKETAERQVERLKARLEIQKAAPDITQGRIFPMMYAPVVISRDGERVIVPMRYHLRPSYADDSFDRERPGCYNARRDNLTSFWKSQFGKNHALLMISGFFENVSEAKYRKKPLVAGESDKNLVIEFRPEGFSEIFVPCLYDVWERPGKPPLISFALITDDPPKEISDAGHDRCPIFLKETAIEGWLNPRGKTAEELLRILAQRETPLYRHQIAAA